MDRQFVVVEWADAWQDQDNFATAHGISQTHGPLIVETMGLVIQDNEVGISLVNERTGKGEEAEFRGRTFIPRAMVIKVTPFNLVKPRKRKSNETPDSHSTDSIPVHHPSSSS